MRLSKKLVAVATVAGLALSATAAYAYWTTTGSGQGSATAASANGRVTLHASFDDGIHPGGDEDVTFTADNSGVTDLYVTTIHLASVSTDQAACDVADFSMEDVTSNSIVAAGADGAAIAGTGSLVFANSSASQDACKGAVITLHLTSN